VNDNGGNAFDWIAGCFNDDANIDRKVGNLLEDPAAGALALEHNGDLYSCDHYVEPGYLLGNIPQTSMAELVYLGETVRVRAGQAEQPA
jgi:sulfatase maturation enzyme AslB (radical SAM superfamily)